MQEWKVCCGLLCNLLKITQREPFLMKCPRVDSRRTQHNSFDSTVFREWGPFRHRFKYYVLNHFNFKNIQGFLKKPSHRFQSRHVDCRPLCWCCWCWFDSGHWEQSGKRWLWTGGIISRPCGRWFRARGTSLQEPWRWISCFASICVQFLVGVWSQSLHLLLESRRKEAWFWREKNK